MRHPRVALAGAVTICRSFPRREKGFPRDASRVVDPRLFRFCGTTGGLALFDDIAARLVQARIDFLQFVLALDLDTKMIKSRLPSARGDREIDAWVVEHPLRVVRFHDGWQSRKQRRIKPD